MFTIIWLILYLILHFWHAISLHAKHSVKNGLKKFHRDYISDFFLQPPQKKLIAFSFADAFAAGIHSLSICFYQVKQFYLGL